MALPLEGMLVLDLSRLLPGPMCSLHLREMGARVIKIEDTGAGDYVRSLGMPEGVVSPAFDILNRGKESIALDIRTPAGYQILVELIKKADVLLESFRPGVMQRLGLDYTSLKAINPALVVCAISGYGQSGPWADKAGHDMNYTATAGILDQCGEAGGAPALSNFQIADLAGGALSAAMAILAALVGRLSAQLRGEPGEGSYLDISMTDCAFANNVIPLTRMNLAGKTAPRGDDMLTGERPCYSVYATGDGKYMAVGALEAKFWARMCDTLEQPQWKARYSDKGAQAEQLRQEVAALFASQPQSHWRDLFDDSDCCVTPILTLEEAFDHPQLLAREMVQVLTNQAGQKLRCPAPAIAYASDGQKHIIQQPGPAQGQHSRAILAELNYTRNDIQQWLDQGVLRAHSSA